MAVLKVTRKFLTIVCLILIVNECQSFLNDQIKDKLKLLDEESNVVQLSELYRNVTLLLGNANSGKSVFAQWITGDDLISQQSDGEFLIKHRNGSAISSHTIFPELLIGDTNAAFYDTPTFTFNIPRSHSIEGAYFLKKVVDHAENLKIVLVVNYSALRQNVDFVSLLTKFATFVKNIDKFKECIGVAVTQVDPNSNTDHIAELLRNVRNNLKHEFQTEIIKLLTVWLQRNEEGEYPRIGVFRKPDKSGMLSEMDQLQSDKTSVKNMLNALEFAKKDNNDFQFITGRSFITNKSLAYDIDDRIRDDVSELVRKVNVYYENLFLRMNETINGFLRDAEIDIEEDDAQNFKNEISTEERRISTVIEELNGKRLITDVSRILVNRFNTIAFKDDVEKIRVSFEYLSFITNYSLTIDRYLFEPLRRNLSSKKEQFEKYVHDLLSELEITNEKLVGSIGNAVEDYYRAKINDTEIEKIISELQDGSNVISQWVNNTCVGDRRWYTLPEQIKNSVFVFSSPSMVSDVDTFMKNGRCFMFLRVFSGVPFDICNSSWVAPLRETKRHLVSLREFMVFVRDVYRKSSGYDIHKFKNNFRNRNFMGSEKKLEDFLDSVLKSSYSTGNFTLEGLNSNKFYKRLLDDVLEKTLRSNLSFGCWEPDTLIVLGDFITFSDFIEWMTTYCRFKISQLKIFALKVVFIDWDIKYHGLQLSIIAPVWDIIGLREINLDGVAGRAYVDHTAYEGTCWGCDGSDGWAGWPGGPGGNFLGIGLKFNNLENLTISARGGSGGPGQNGGFGAMGIDGRRAFFGVDETVLHSMMYYDYGCRRNCFYSGERGQKGGNGGKGGVGGLGGRGGNITLISLGESISLHSRKENGEVGLWGVGGGGGMGGLAGEDIFVTECWKIPDSAPKCEGMYSIVSNNHGMNGWLGYANYSSIGFLQPEEGKEPPSIADNVRVYKHYLRKNLEDYFKTSSLLEFTSALDSNPEIQNTVDYQALQNEFLDLEMQRGNQPLDDYFIAFYESLLERTNQYAENPKDYDLSNTEALENLATSIVDKISD